MFLGGRERGGGGGGPRKYRSSLRVRLNADVFAAAPLPADPAEIERSDSRKYVCVRRLIQVKIKAEAETKYNFFGRCKHEPYGTFVNSLRFIIIIIIVVVVVVVVDDDVVVVVINIIIPSEPLNFSSVVDSILAEVEDFFLCLTVRSPIFLLGNQLEIHGFTSELCEATELFSDPSFVPSVLAASRSGDAVTSTGKRAISVDRAKAIWHR